MLITKINISNLRFIKNSLTSCMYFLSTVNTKIPFLS